MRLIYENSLSHTAEGKRQLVCIEVLNRENLLKIILKKINSQSLLYFNFFFSILILVFYSINKHLLTI